MNKASVFSLLWTAFAFATRCPNNHYYDDGSSSCKPHSKCKHQGWEVKYAGPNNDVKCEIRQPCHHTYCRISTPEHYELVNGKMQYRSSGHKFGHERVIVQHDHKDHDFGSTHHHCAVNKRTMQCQCMCHNEKLDRNFAYAPHKRYYWKKTERTVLAKTSDCDSAVYSPQGQEAPSVTSLCTSENVGEKLAIVDDGVFVPFGKSNVWAGTRSAQGNTIVSFANDHISWAGRPATCEGSAARAPQHRTATVFECVYRKCNHPKCCDCGNNMCSAGEGAQQCRLHCEQDEYMDLRTRTCVAQAACAYNQWEKKAATEHSGRQCQDISHCPSTHYEKAAPTATSDRECAKIANCSDSNPAEWPAVQPQFGDVHVDRGRFQSGHHTIAPFQGTRCETYSFKRPFTSMPRIVVQATHRDSSTGLPHHSVSAWTEWANATQFRACWRELNFDDTHTSEHMKLDYFAWQGDRIGDMDAGTAVTAKLSPGVSCHVHKFRVPFAAAPFVVGSIDHTNIGDKTMVHHAVNAWLEGISASQFKVCFRESTYDKIGSHSPVNFHYLAFSHKRSTAVDATGRSEAIAGGQTIVGTACKWISYGTTFLAKPTVLATANHHYAKETTPAVEPQHDSLSTWVEKVQKHRFQVCVREDDGHDDKHLASVYVDWIVVAKRFTNQRVCEDAGTCANGELIPRWQDRLQKNHCGSCDEGYWLNPMTRSCIMCPAGHYCTNSIKAACGADRKYSASGAAMCKTCEPGSFTSGDGMTTRSACTICPAGRRCDGSSAQPMCGAGKFSGRGKSSCTKCNSDKKYSGKGATSCKSCKLGSFTSGGDKATRTACSRCPAGRKCDGSSKKSRCAAGRYAPGGRAGCTKCKDDTKYSGQGAASCKTCKPGSFTSGGDRDQRTTCTICPAGRRCNGSSTKKVAAKKVAANKVAAKKATAKKPAAGRRSK